MKRPYEDPDSSDGDKPSSNSRLSSHRRYYSKYIDDDRYHRKRPDPDRRRYDRDDSYSAAAADRMHRSDSFSSPRREIPKGCRSDRDRSRSRRDCDATSGSSWRRSPSLTSSEDRGVFRSSDPQSKQAEDVKPVSPEKEPKRSGGSGSEMEEGELEPEPDPDPEPAAQPSLDQGETENNDVSDGSEMEAILRDELGLDDDDSSEEKPAVDLDVRSNKSPDLRDVIIKSDSQNENVNLTNEVNEPKIIKEELLSLKSTPTESKVQGEEQISASRHSAALELKEALTKKDDTARSLQLKRNEGRGFDLEAEPEGATAARATIFINLCKEDGVESTHEEDDSKVKDIHNDKGKDLEISVSGKVEDDNDMGGTSIRGFELVFRSEVAPLEQTIAGGVVVKKQKDDKTKLEPLDLSLGLQGNHFEQTSENLNLKHASPSHATSVQSLPTSFRTSSFRTMSDGFTTSISFSGSQPFSHNPSCSLTNNSMDNYEQSVGSHPIFKGVDQLSNGTIWKGQSSNELKRNGGGTLFQGDQLSNGTVWRGQSSNKSKQNGGGGALFQGVDQLSNGTIWHGQTSNDIKRNGGGGTLLHRALMGDNPSQSSLHAPIAQHQSKPDGLPRQSSLPRQLSLAQSHGSHDTLSENSKDKRLLTKASSSSSLFRSDQKEGEAVPNGVGVVERILSKIVTEPLQVTSRMLHEMTGPSVAYLKETISLLVGNKDKHGHIRALQEALKRRSDLTVGTLSNCTRVLLEILVALKTGLADFLRINDSVPSTDLVEIFLNLKCRNIVCRSMLPVDECDCRICAQKNGFCRECMCLVCSKFDMASNTCSWVGCDLCLHWCHTDCGLRESHIRNGRSSSSTQDTTEMQFHCVACNHPSEMFGFVKEVFKTCSKVWKVETLAKELRYVRQIFSASNDSRGKKLGNMSDQMLMKLEDKSNHSEVINCIMAFLSEDESNSMIGTSTLPPKDPLINIEASNTIACPKKDSTWLPSVSAEKVSQIENMAALSSMNDRLGRQARDAELQDNLEKKPIIDELDSVVRLKQAEAKMYQERADDARREAEGLKRIAVAKNVKIEEDYATRIAKLRLTESQERRRQKLEELQVIERAQREYFNMKVRMEADIKDLLLKMEATKRNFST